MRIARSTGAFTGLLIAILGVWGALIPFVGPYFDYSFGSNATWHYTTNRLWLCILPGALAVLGGMLMIVAARRASGVLGGWLAVLAGAWFAIGPAVSLTWEHAEGPIGRPLYGTTRQALELVGYFYGLGALIVALAAFAIGRFAPARMVRATPAAEERVPADGAATARGPGHEPRRGRREGVPVRRRVPFLRRGRAARGEAPRSEAPAPTNAPAAGPDEPPRSDAEAPAR